MNRRIIKICHAVARFLQTILIFPKNFFNFKFDTTEKQSIINLSCYKVRVMPL